MIVTVTYRYTKYPINVQKSTTVQQLIEEVAKLTEISPGNFCLKLHQILLDNRKTMSTYVNEGTDFVMVNVTINLFVEFNNKKYTVSINENSTIQKLKEEIQKQSKIPIQSVNFNSKTLEDDDTILSSNIKNNDNIVAVNNISKLRIQSVIFNSKTLEDGDTILSRNIKKNDNIVAVNNINRMLSSDTIVTVTYRYTKYPINVEKSMTVLQLSEEVARLTKIPLGNFCLRQQQTVLDNLKKVYTYITKGTDFVMTDVIVKLFVDLFNKIYTISINENCTITKLKEEIKKKSDVPTAALYCNNYELEDANTILSSELENNDHIIAAVGLSGGQKWTNI